VTTELSRALLSDELPKVRETLGESTWSSGRYEEAAQLFDTLCTGPYSEFLTLPAYDRID
jgi:malate synthase